MAIATLERKSWSFPNATAEEPNGWLSPSQVTEFLGCPFCYYLARVKKVPKPVHVSLPMGGGLHKAVEHIRTKLVGGPRQGGGDPTTHIPEAIDLAAGHFEQSLTVDEETGGEIIVDMSDYGELAEVKDHTVKLARYLLPEITKLDVQRGLLHAETEIADLDVPNPWPFRIKGRIDAMYGENRGENDFVVMGEDLKTGKKQEAPGLSAAIQCAIYDSFIGGVRWAVDVLAKTKTPSFKSYWMGERGYLDEGEHRRVRELVLDVADRISAGDFPKRPSWMCKYEHGYPIFRVAVSGFGE
jgi:hypothetical protein